MKDLLAQLNTVRSALTKDPRSPSYLARQAALVEELSVIARGSTRPARRQTALEALAEIGGDRARTALERAAEMDEHAGTREVATAALRPVRPVRPRFVWRKHHRRITDADLYCRCCRDHFGRLVERHTNVLTFQCLRCRVKWDRYAEVTRALRRQHEADVRATQKRLRLEREAMAQRAWEAWTSSL